MSLFTVRRQDFLLLEKKGFFSRGLEGRWGEQAGWRATRMRNTWPSPLVHPRSRLCPQGPSARQTPGSRKRLVCVICPWTRPTGFLLGPRHLLAGPGHPLPQLSHPWIFPAHLPTLYPHSWSCMGCGLSGPRPVDPSSCPNLAGLRVGDEVTEKLLEAPPHPRSSFS